MLHRQVAVCLLRHVPVYRTTVPCGHSSACNCLQGELCCCCWATASAAMPASQLRWRLSRARPSWSRQAWSWGTAACTQGTRHGHAHASSWRGPCGGGQRGSQTGSTHDWSLVAAAETVPLPVLALRDAAKKNCNTGLVHMPIRCALCVIALSKELSAKPSYTESQTCPCRVHHVASKNTPSPAARSPVPVEEAHLQGLHAVDELSIQRNCLGVLQGPAAAA
jgi:hypothetical protein